jgi:hypothetical protein
VAQYRIHFWAFVSTVMNPLVSFKAGDFLTTSLIICSLGRTVLCGISVYVDCSSNNINSLHFFLLVTTSEDRLTTVPHHLKLPWNKAVVVFLLARKEAGCSLSFQRNPKTCPSFMLSKHYMDLHNFKLNGACISCTSASHMTSMRVSVTHT